MNNLSQIFFRGLVTLLPITLTIYILYSGIIIADNVLGSVLREILPTYIPGLGLISIAVLIFIFGLILNNYVAAKLLALAEKKLLEVPLIRAVFSPLRDLMNLFSKKNNKTMQQVVLVNLGATENLMLGVVTRENMSGLNLDPHTNEKVAVYFPFSYALGGYTLLIPKKDIKVVNLPIEKAMSLAITGWVSSETKIEDKKTDNTEEQSEEKS